MEKSVKKDELSKYKKRICCAINSIWNETKCVSDAYECDVSVMIFFRREMIERESDGVEASTRDDHLRRFLSDGWNTIFSFFKV